MKKNFPSTLSGIAGYYASKLAEHGDISKGVDWNGLESQLKRFNQLCKVIQSHEEFSVNDLGCGYGALVDHLQKNYSAFSYHGYDISPEMIFTARSKYPEYEFSLSDKPERVADFSVASGIFNVKLDCSEREWVEHIEKTLRILDGASRKGFSFNVLTSYSDIERMQDHLFYANPCSFFDFCKRNFSRNVALLHDYDLYEFTILVRK